MDASSKSWKRPRRWACSVSPSPPRPRNRSLGFGRDAFGRGVHHRLEPRQEVLVSVLRIAGEIRLELRNPLQALLEPGLADLVGGEDEAFLFHVAGVEDLLELSGYGLDEPGLVQV